MSNSKKEQLWTNWTNKLMTKQVKRFDSATLAGIHLDIKIRIWTSHLVIMILGQAIEVWLVISQMNLNNSI